MRRLQLLVFLFSFFFTATTYGQQFRLSGTVTDAVTMEPLIGATIKIGTDLVGWKSDDGCCTWDDGVILHEGKAAYSDLAELEDGTVLCLYECGEESPYERIVLARGTV